MTIFVDTSALYALLDEGDADHAPAAAWLSGSLADNIEPLVTHNYVIVETGALVQRRLGPDAVRTLFDDMVAALDVRFVDEHLHRIALAAHLAAAGRRPSLVDWVSFQMMKEHGIVRAFAFDSDFAAQGFDLLP